MKDWALLFGTGLKLSEANGSSNWFSTRAPNLLVRKLFFVKLFCLEWLLFCCFGGKAEGVLNLSSGSNCALSSSKSSSPNASLKSGLLTLLLKFFPSFVTGLLQQSIWSTPIKYILFKYNNWKIIK